MLAFNKIFNQLRRIIAIAFLAGLVFLTSLPASAQPTGGDDYSASRLNQTQIYLRPSAFICGSLILYCPKPS